MSLLALYKIVETYLKEKGAPKGVLGELDAMMELVQRVVTTPPTASCTEEAIKTLQYTV